MTSKQKTRRIPLTQGKFAIVDAEDFDRLNQHKWYVVKDRNTYYALRKIKSNGRQTILSMHQEIMPTPKGMEINYINHNGLDNCKANLRFCTHQQVQFTRKKIKAKTSRFKGVSWYKKYRKWAALIRHNYKCYFLGYFDNEVEAANAYNTKAIELFGEFARLNFPKDQVA